MKSSKLTFTIRSRGTRRFCITGRVDGVIDSSWYAIRKTRAAAETYVRLALEKGSNFKARRATIERESKMLTKWLRAREGFRSNRLDFRRRGTTVDKLVCKTELEPAT